MRDPVQIVLLVDLASDNPLPIDDVLSRLPPTTARRAVIRATECGGRQEPRGAPTDWNGCADAVTRIVERAREIIPPDGEPYRFFIAGRAALPIFVHLGAQLSRWSMHVTQLNQRGDGSWDVIEIDGRPDTALYFEIEGLGRLPSDATGHVAVVVSSQLEVTKDQILQFAKANGASLAGIVTARATGSPLDASAGPGAARQLAQLMTDVKQAYPNTSGVLLFVAGPATLAFMSGRAMNENVIPEAWVANYAVGAYELALIVPRRSSASRPVERSAEREGARATLLTDLRAEISDLQGTLQAEDVGPVLDAAGAARFADRLRGVVVADRPEGDDFDLSVHEGRLSLGRGLLDALASHDAATAARIAQLVVLHEVFHERQNLESTTYFGIGRAGFALEEVDYAADAFAAEALTRWSARRAGAGTVRELATQVIRAVLIGVEAFDRFQQGDRIERLAERRLRRYLIWHLQHVRAMTVQTLDDLHQLLSARLVAELAPLPSYLDDRYDKFVRKALPATELVIALDGVLGRTQAGPGFDAVRLVDAVRTYDVEAMTALMKFCRDTQKALLIPWANE